MATRYPLIKDTLTARQRALNTAGTEESPGSALSTSDYSTLSTLFPNSPVYSSAAPFTSNNTYRSYASEYLLPDNQSGDADQFPDGVNLNYAGAPNLATPPTGLESSYYPNRRANSNPAGGEGTPVTEESDKLTAGDNFGSGYEVTNDAMQPSTTSPAIAGTTLGDALPLGQSLAHALGSGASSTTAFSTSRPPTVS